MCGVFFLRADNNKNIISSKTANLIYEIHKERGPDENSDIIFDNWMMVHTRLSITNPDSGQQPITNTKKNAYLIFNGEIYNYKLLAKNLDILDISNYSDTDILFKLIEKFGFQAAIKKLRGMFAIIYFDVELNKIYVARDHFGQKPIWIYEKNGVIGISSTIKALLKVFNCAINSNKILPFISKQGKSCPSDSIFESIEGLRAGQILEIDKDCRKNFYYFFTYEDLIEPKINNYKFNEIKESFEEVIKNTIKIHSDTKSNLGVLLSGGFDSSMILGYTNDFIKPKLGLTKLCPSIEKIPLNVVPKILEQYPTDCIFKVITPSLYFKELFLFIKNNLTIPNWGGTPAMRNLAREAKFRNIKVLLGGDGVDESLMGYKSHLESLEKRKNNGIHSVLLGEELLTEYSAEDNKNILEKRLKIESSLLNHLNFNEALPQSFLYQDTLEFLQRCNLPSADLFSMNESIELRNPFVDYEFLNFSLNIPLK